MAWISNIAYQNLTGSNFYLIFTKEIADGAYRKKYGRPVSSLITSKEK